MSKDQTIVIRGELTWAKVTGEARPYQGNPKYDKGPSWSLDITPDAASRKTMKAVGIDGKLREPKEGDFRKESFLTLRHLLNRPDGTKNKPLPIKSVDGREWDDSNLGNGTIADVRVKIKDYGSGSDKGSYVQAIRVLRHVPYESTDFEPLSEDDEFFAAGAEDDPVETGSDNGQPASDELDDVPF